MNYPISVSGIGLIDGKFGDGNPATGQQPSLIASQWANQLTDELINLITYFGLTPSEVDSTQVLQAVLRAASVPIGGSIMWNYEFVPDFFLEEGGGSIRMGAYRALYGVGGAQWGLGAGATITFDYGNDVINCNAHGLDETDIVELTTTGTLPTGLATGTPYYVVNPTASAYKISLTDGGEPITFSDAGTGSHSAHNEMKLMDSRGDYPRGWSHGSGNSPDVDDCTDRGDGTVGDHVWTKQGCATQRVQGTWAVGDDDTGNFYCRPKFGTGAVQVPAGSQYRMNLQGMGQGLGDYYFEFDNALVVATSAYEDRPRGHNRMFIVRYI